MNVQEILGPWTDVLHEEIAGTVRLKKHPWSELYTIGYTEKAQFDRQWNQVTLNARGLIFSSRTLEVIARPFPKFFNWGEQGADFIASDEQVFAFDKIDGSLGITYRDHRGTLLIATRGSFNSEQAEFASDWLARTHPEWEPPNGWTALFEIVYPDNRIVVDYGDFEGLIFLGFVEIETGDFMWYPELWPGRSTELLYTGSFGELFNLPSRQNAEGFVVVTEDGRRVKVKYDEYLVLHKIVTNLNDKTIFEALRDGKFADLMDKVPDEFHAMVDEIRAYLMDLYMELWHETTAVIHDLMHEQFFGKLLERRDIALWMHEQRFSKVVQSCVWRWVDNKAYGDILWKEVDRKRRELNKDE